MRRGDPEAARTVLVTSGSPRHCAPCVDSVLAEQSEQKAAGNLSPSGAKALARIAEWAAASGVNVHRYVREIGSGLNDKRRELAALLDDPQVATIVVEHRDRLARFGVAQLERVLKANKRDVLVIEPGEVEDDLVRDMIDLMTCFSARLYGRRAGPGRAATGRRRASPRFKLAGKKCRLDVLRGRLGKAESEMVEGRARICFGGRQALRDGDVDAWRAKRRSHIFLVGSKSEGPCGNQSVHWDGAALRLRLPDAMGGGYAILHGVRFRYGQAELLRLLERNRDKATRVGMTWLIVLGDDNRWHAHVTVEEPVAEVVTYQAYHPCRLTVLPPGQWRPRLVMGRPGLSVRSCWVGRCAGPAVSEAGPGGPAGPPDPPCSAAPIPGRVVRAGACAPSRASRRTPRQRRRSVLGLILACEVRAVPSIVTRRSPYPCAARPTTRAAA